MYLFLNNIFQIVVVDFEYASPNPAAFDIANHFHEWTANYHSSVPHLLDPSLYPSLEDRRNFYRAYLAHASVPPESTQDLELEMQKLDRQAQIWSPSSHAMWAIWALVQARESVESQEEAPEFDYVRHARDRMEGFRRAIKELGL